MVEKIKSKLFTKEIFKSIWFWGILIFLLVTGAAYGSGKANANITLNNEKANLETVAATIEKQKSELQEELNLLESSIEDKEDELRSVEKEIVSMQKDIDDAKEIMDKKDSLEDKISSFESRIKSEQTKLDDLTAEVEAKQTELEKLETVITSKGEEPIKLSPGQYIVGTDFPAGRYIAKPNGGNGNFVVYSDTGDLEVNTILGTSYGETSYTFFTFDGYYLENDAPVILEAVE